ncbi:MAG: DNA (cytosine-5-)-methyltransferase [Lachnospiraceae bacterium]|nr:DNA (cytosine-5-)-methyltransferase [Lachnospiraceae bacterium]
MTENYEQNKKQLTLGSLFSGSGGFELAGVLAGIKPVFNCEVEPFAIAVTNKRFPDVKHYGDVSALSGAELEPVDIITWGSPCQGLSLAGKRKGLKDERSGLYIEAVRIVKEMLESTNREYPKFCVFENVAGLLSSTDGEDFITCLDKMQELGFLPDANILDAQFMGVPQRRKRVFITWLQVDYILRKRTPLSDSITLQLLTEILQINLAGLLRAYGIELKKSAARKFTDAGDGVKRRINLFSLQKENRLQMLQQRLEDIKATLSKGQSSSDSSLGDVRTVKIISTPEDMKSEGSITESRSWSIWQLLKSALEEGLQIENGSITSIWTKEIITRKIFIYFQVLLNTLDVTIHLFLSLEKEPMLLNCFEWVRYVLTETRGFIDETKKYKRSSGQMVWHDNIRFFEQEFQTKEEQIERYFAEICGHEILPEFKSLFWNSSEGFRTWKGTAGNTPQGTGTAGGSRRSEGEGIVLNDQGGQRMDVTEDVTCTLRAESHHPPCVIDGAVGFCTEHSAKSRSIGYEEEKSPTLRAGVVPAVQMYENHSQDTRYTGPLEVAPTVSATYGMGGNNQPFVTEEEKSCYWDGSQTAGTLTHRNASGSQRMPDKENFNCVLETEKVSKQKAYGISAFKSNAMLSGNPHSGIYEAETSRTLDCNGGSPINQQGGIAIVEEESVAFAQNQRNEVRNLGDKTGALQAESGMKQQTYVLQGNMIGRSDKNGPQGCGVSEDVCYTLTDVDRHAVAAPDPVPMDTEKKNDPSYGIDRAAFNQGQNAKFGFSIEEELSPTLVSKGPNAVSKTDPVSKTETHYTVRRLTPTECARLQGFPSVVDVKTGDLSCDEVALIALAAGFIEVDESTGNVYGTRGPGGIKREQPIKLKGSIVNGYRVYSIHAEGVKKQIRANRLVWMSAHGRIPEGYVVDHINNIKLDNRLCNLQLLTAEDNSHKAKEDGLYPTGDACAYSKISVANRKKLSFLYWSTDKPISYFAEMFGISWSRAQQIIHEYEWVDELANQNPTDEELKFWMDVWETHRKVVSHASKPKTEKQVRKWLANPYSDSAVYRLYGNGVALPCVYFVMCGIVWAAEKEM